MFQPNITHMPCDLNQQQKRHDARKDSLARAVAWRNGKRSLLDRLLRRAVDEWQQTIVMVTHDAGAAAMADRILFLADGRIVRDLEESTAAEVLAAMQEVTSR